jgi:acetoin utilization deacetylase AcuC-like enzyme
MATGLAYHEDFLKHVTGSHHPERPVRLLAILEGLEESGLRKDLVPLLVEPVDSRWVLTVHSPHYLRRLEQACLDGLPYLDTPECAVSADSYRVALLAAGACTGAIDAVMADRVRRAFCPVRPPGHHAEHDAAMGFCYLNNTAIAANYARLQHGVERVLIFDWDVHHGNGTQHAFEGDPDVFFCSIHQDPRTLYPGTGYATERGIGPGKGTTLNLPMPAGSSDAEYRQALTEHFLPAAEAFAPQLVLLSVGFDAHSDDPLASIRLSDESFAWMGRMICSLADRYASGRLISILEGGYNLDVLKRCVPEHVAILCGHPTMHAV